MIKKLQSLYPWFSFSGHCFSLSLLLHHKSV
jgi:hypothetical protein